MTRRSVPWRTHVYLPVEGESEQSFVKWLEQLAKEEELHVNLDCQPLGGGGYKKMLELAVRYRKRKERDKAKNTILLVDSDRAERGDDGWSIEQLTSEADEHKIIVCQLKPNLEGLFLCLMPGKENLQPDAATVRKQLQKVWPDYGKPADARTLATKFNLGDLLRVARIDLELRILLSTIGFKICNA